MHNASAEDTPAGATTPPHANVFVQHPGSDIYNPPCLFTPNRPPTTPVPPKHFCYCAAGKTAIEQISYHYGKQAVVVSIDPRRVYVSDPSAAPKHTCVRASVPGPNGEQWCWWQCTVKGGREGRDLDAVQLAVCVEAMGAGEILLNCIDNDGKNGGFDLPLVEAVAAAVTIPVIASSGAGKPEHFSAVFNGTRAAAALAAGIFHRQEVAIGDVKKHLVAAGIPARL